MKLYGVLEGYDYEGDTLRAIFSTKDKAEQYVKNLESENQTSHKIITECELDESI